MRLVFMGTPDFAVPTLDALVAAGHSVAAVYCQPPRRAGRGKAFTPSPVQRRAETLGIEVRTPASLRDREAQAAFAALDVDAAVVAAYGLILPRPILDAPRLGCLNVHASLLPRWRGAAPIHRAILAGDAVTGVTIMQMEAGLDTGPMLANVETPVDRKTGGELTAELAESGAALLVDVLGDLPGHSPVAQPDAGVTYASKIDKAEARIDFSRAAEEVERQVRAFNPVPGAYFEFAGERIKVLQAQPISCHSRERGNPDTPTSPNRSAAMDPRLRGDDDEGLVLNSHLLIACGTGALRPTLVQRAGRAAMTPDELLRGFPIPVGTRL